jgi:DNA repair protein RAD50
MTNLRENLRVRKLMRDIVETQAEIDSLDMEQAAKAKRHFEEKYKVEKQRETQMQSQVS